MISNIGNMHSAMAGMRLVRSNKYKTFAQALVDPMSAYSSTPTAYRSNLSIKKKREEERAERKRKLLAYRNKQ